MQYLQVNDEPGAAPSLFIHRMLGDLCYEWKVWGRMSDFLKAV